MATGAPELDDVIETLRYRLVVSQEPGAAVVAVAHLLAEIPDWLDELVDAMPRERRRVEHVKDRQWRKAAAAVTSAGAQCFGQLTLLDELPA